MHSNLFWQGKMAFGSAVRYSQSSEVTEYFFGTVVKAGESIDPVTGLIKTGGSTNYAIELVGNTTTTQAMALLHLGTIRYPGGGENRFFNITDATDLDGLKRAIDYCAKNDLSLNFTIDDAQYINPATQIASINATQRAALVHFLQVSLVGYAIAKGVHIESIHLANEFTGEPAIDGQKAYIGYGKVSAVLIHEIDAAFDRVDFTAASGRPQIVIEPPNWANSNQQADFFKILKSSIGADGQTAASKIYAVDLHGAGTGGPSTTNTLALTWDTYFGRTPNFNYESNLRNIIEFWENDSAMQHIHFRNSAWAYAESSALSEAALGMLQIHTASKLGLISVTNYVGYNLDNSALIYSGNGSIGLRAGGALFAMMSKTLRGTEAVGFSNAAGLQAESLAPSLTRAFAGGDHVVLYNVNRTNGNLPTDIDVNSLLASLETFVGGAKGANVDILGSTNPTNKNGVVTHEFLHLNNQNLLAGSTDFVLNAYEIAQIDIIANGIFGNAKNDIMQGGIGQDVLHGLGGNDVIRAGNGADSLAGGTGDDQLFGDAGNDVLFGGIGADALNGGVGIDTASYAFSESFVIVNLSNPMLNSGDAAGDDYISIENVIGSGFDDQLTGNSLANSLFGGRGNDTFFFSGGADIFFGDVGNGDAIQIDQTATRISLFDGSSSRGITFLGIENVFGGGGNDSLTGNASFNTLAGGTGDDMLSGFGGDDLLRGGPGRDQIYGGAGNDQLAGGSGLDTSLGGSGNDAFIFYFMSEGGDKINDFSAVVGNDDIIYFNASAFGNLALGRLSATNFCTTANTNIGLDSNDLFVFRQSDKTLWFDADGKGGTAPILIVDLQNTAANITVNDIWLF